MSEKSTKKKVAKAIHQAMSDGKQEEALQLLRESNIDVNTKVSKEPFLYTAVSHSLLDVVEYLLDKQANPNCHRVWGYTYDYRIEVPLSAARRPSPEKIDVSVQIAKMLLEKGADPNGIDGSESPLHSHALSGNIPMIELLLSHGAKVDLCDWEDETPLFKACLGGRLEAAELLINHGAEINSSQKSPVWAAIFYNHHEMVKFLISKGADPNLCDDTGEPLLMTACMRANLEGAKILVEAGADVKPMMPRDLDVCMVCV